MAAAGEKRTGADATPATRWVVLGASNLTRGLPIVLTTVRSRSPAPLEFFVAEGNGRSYGQTSRVLWRELPGILECGLWRALRERAPVPTAALLTDVGNDLLYDVPVEQIDRWVDECLARLVDAGARIAMTELPIDNLQNLSPRRFLFFRRIYVPQCRLSLTAVRDRAHALNASLHATAERRGAVLLPQSRAWYGVDPMHIRASTATQTWQTILTPVLPANTSITQIPREKRESWRLLQLRPELRRMWGKEQRGVQPALQYADGTRLSLY